MANTRNSSIVLVKGPPRSGKTTLVKKLLKRISVPVSGFYTEEVRKSKTRIGFDVIDVITSKKFPLARKRKKGDQPKVGSYSVFVDEFENYINETDFNTALVVIDEIGKMELLSSTFQELISILIKTRSLLATIPVYTHPLVKLMEEIKHSRLFLINKSTRKRTTNQVMAHLGDLEWI